MVQRYNIDLTNQNIFNIFCSWDIYLVLEVDDKGSESHKIGSTKNDPLTRLKQLKTGNLIKLVLLNFMNLIIINGLKDFFIKKYISKQTLASNEWFNLSDEDVLNFLKNAKLDNILDSFSENHF